MNQTNITSDQAEKDIEKVKTQANALTTLINDLMNQYREPLSKIAILETALYEHQTLLSEKEKTIQKLKTTFKKEVQKLESTVKDEESKMMKIFEEREQKIAKLEKKISSSTTIISNLGKNQMVKLNVGGKLFATNLITLRSVKDTFFTGYFSEYFNPQPESDGAFFIDRPFEQFHLILNYLRGINIEDTLEELDMKELKEFIEEIVYYQLTPIYEILPIHGLSLLKSKYGIDISGLVQTPNFDRNYFSSKISIQSPTRVRKESYSCYGGYYDACVLGSESVSSFKVKLISNCSNLMIGFANRNVNLNGKNYDKHNGYFIGCENGKLYSNGNEKTLYGSFSMNSDGTIIECIYKNGKISFIVNGQNYGVAFSNVPPGLYPAFDVWDNGCTFEFVDY